MAVDEKHTLSPEDVDALASILRELKDNARQAAQNNKQAVARMYQVLIKKASPIVTAAHARLEREENAALNKEINPPKS